MKKYISIFIVFLMIFNIISSSFNFKKLYGADLKEKPIKKINTENLKEKPIKKTNRENKENNKEKIEIIPSFSKSLTEGGVNTTPSVVDIIQNIKPNTMLVSMNIKDLEDRGETTLYYLKSKKEKIEFKIENFKTGYKGKYEVYKWEDNKWERKKSNFKIYAGNSGLEPVYHDVETYKDKYNSQIHGITENSTSEDVTFIFGKNQGFSFKDDEEIVHFRVSMEKDYIDIVFNNIKGGYLYNFYGKSKNMEGTVSAFTGINVETLNSIPFSTDHMEDIDSIEGKSNRELRDLRNDKYILNAQKGEKPVKEEVGISIRLDEPMVLWIDKSNDNPNFSPVSKLKDENKYSMEVSIRMLDNRTGDIKNDQLKIGIKDILTLKKGEKEKIKIENSLETKPRPSEEENGSFVRLLAESKESEDGIIEPGVIELRLNRLNTGTLFTGAEIYSDIKVDLKESILSKGANKVAYGKLFTFLEYSFVYRASAFFVEVVPYKGIKGVYYLTMNNSLASKQEGKPNKNIYLSLPVTTEETYQIFFAPEENPSGDSSTDLKKMVYSEKSRYRPNDLDLDFNAPTDFKIVDYNLRAEKSSPNNSESYGAEGIIYMKLRWSIGKAEDIKYMIEKSEDNTISVEYNINKGLVPEKDKTVHFAKLSLTIKKIDENKYEGTYVVKELTEEKEIDSNTYELKEVDEKYFVETNFEIKGKRSIKKLENEDKDITFYYPRIYFLNVGVISEIIKESLFDSLTLNDILKLKLPSPKDLKENESKLTKNSFQISWINRGKEILDFIEKNDFNFEEDKLNFFVNLYISQNIEKVKEISKLNTVEDRKKYSVNFNFDDMGKNPISFKGEPIDNLRKFGKESKILRIEGFDLSNYEKDIKDGKDFMPELVLKDLDPNQKYYLNISLGLKYETEEGVIELESILSSILGVTTKDKEKIPGDEDKIPAPPKISIKDILQDRSIVTWEYVDLPNKDKDIDIKYQIIRTTNKQLDKKYLNTHEDIKFYHQLLEKELKGVENVILETNDEPIKDGKYVPNIFDGTQFKPADISRFQLNYKSKELELLDNTLSSNQIYFYYVRTVRIVKNKVRYSIWSVENCTTSNLKKPINLFVETNRDDYDKKSEFIIRFDVPINNIDLIGKEYILQYSIKEEDGVFSDPIDMDSEKLKSNASESKVENHTNFTYRISGLKSGRSYSIKVRLKSIISGDISAYSNIAITRTDMDQEDYEKEKDIEKWIDYFKEELNKLTKYPYWIIKDTKEEFIVVYRQVMFGNIINANEDSTIELAKSEKKANKEIYYIPYKIILDAIKENKSFKISSNNIDIVIPAKSFDEDSDEEINKILHSIKNKKIEELYIKLILEENKYNFTVNNYDPLTNKIDIDFESVSSTLSNLKWDKDTLEIYIKEIDKESSSNYIKNYITESILRKTSKEEIIKHIRERVESIKENIIKQTGNSLNRTLKENYIINKLGEHVFIILKDKNQHVIKGFVKNDSKWIEKETIDFLEYKGISIDLSGSYIFVGKNIVINGLENKDNNSIIKIISRYDLGDILGENFINAESLATREMAVNITARMAGATKKNNSKKFLSSKGYNVSNLNNKNIISLEEYIYLMMLIYEIRTNTNIDTIYIRNNIITDDLKDVDKKYEKSIKAAMELGLYKNTENMKLKSKITIKEMLEMLQELDNKSYL